MDKVKPQQLTDDQKRAYGFINEQGEIDFADPNSESGGEISAEDFFSDEETDNAGKGERMTAASVKNAYVGQYFPGKNVNEVQESYYNRIQKKFQPDSPRQRQVKAKKEKYLPVLIRERFEQ